MKKRGLTPKQARFVAAYVRTLNATAAAIEAGYSQRTAAAQGWRLLGHPPVSQALAERQAEIRSKADLDAEAVIEEVRRVAFANAGDFFEWGPEGVRIKPSLELTPEQMSAVLEVSHTVTAHGGRLRVKLFDKLAALDKLARHLGLYAEAPRQNLAVALVPDPCKTREEWQAQADEWKARAGAGPGGCC